MSMNKISSCRQNINHIKTFENINAVLAERQRNQTDIGFIEVITFTLT